MPKNEVEERIKIPVSAVAEYLYCPRRFYYRMVEGAEETNYFLIEGRLQEELREERATQTRDCVRQQRKIVIASDYHGITGELDVIEEKDGLRYPVEHKRGLLREAVNDDVQVCCQLTLPMPKGRGFLGD
ncbi:MAG: CRISPR-associated protein Cas4 [Dethiobacter sp.]